MSVIKRYLAAACLLLPSTLFAQSLGPRDVDHLPASKPTAVLNYGTGPLQIGELRLPEGKGPFPVAVVIHGGCWTKGLATLQNTAPIASDLTKSGVATWNIEYRQVGDDDGGWPGTFLDWGAAVDDLREMAKTYPLDLSRVVVVGHSAGAHAALWVAARNRLPAESEIRGADPLPIKAAVAIDGPCDLVGFVGLDEQVWGMPATVGLMGGTPSDYPKRYAQASPQALLQLGLPQFLISANAINAGKAQEYQKLAQAKGDHVEIASIDTGHFELIAPGQDAWAQVKRVILDQALGLGRGPGSVK
jgi:pimeloyl-ACP methyl ester carboxylesterase